MSRHISARDIAIFEDFLMCINISWINDILPVTGRVPPELAFWIGLNSIMRDILSKYERYCQREYRQTRREGRKRLTEMISIGISEGNQRTSYLQYGNHVAHVCAFSGHHAEP